MKRTWTPDDVIGLVAIGGFFVFLIVVAICAAVTP